jgi:hypothetical protein
VTCYFDIFSDRKTEIVLRVTVCSPDATLVTTAVVAVVVVATVVAAVATAVATVVAAVVATVNYCVSLLLFMQRA